MAQLHWTVHLYSLQLIKSIKCKLCFQQTQRVHTCTKHTWHAVLPRWAAQTCVQGARKKWERLLDLEIWLSAWQTIIAVKQSHRKMEKNFVSKVNQNINNSYKIFATVSTRACVPLTLTSVALRKPEKSATMFPCVSITPFGFPKEKHTDTLKSDLVNCTSALKTPACVLIH